MKAAQTQFSSQMQEQTPGGFYIVEISTANNGSLSIAAFDINSPESLMIELHDERKVSEILRQFGGSYSQLADCLQVIHKRLVLLNPNFNQQ